MIHYNADAIERTQNWLIERASKSSTPNRIAGHLYEAAETIAQLKKELKEKTTPAEKMIQFRRNLNNEQIACFVIPSETSDEKFQDAYSLIQKMMDEYAKTHNDDFSDFNYEAIIGEALKKAGVKAKPPFYCKVYEL